MLEFIKKKLKDMAKQSVIYDGFYYDDISTIPIELIKLTKFGGFTREGIIIIETKKDCLEERERIIRKRKADYFTWFFEKENCTVDMSTLRELNQEEKQYFKSIDISPENIRAVKCVDIDKEILLIQ